jgi:hypothetical protein
VPRLRLQRKVLADALTGRAVFREGNLVRIAIATACALALCGCKAYFDGPYACETGYASCVNPDRNQCETDITSDAAHCGVCGNPCAVGAMCLDSVCTAGAVKLASVQNGTVPNIAANSTGVYWGFSSDSQITTVALSGGAPTPAATGVTGCGNSGLAFGLDDNNLYYWSNSLPCTGGGCTTSGLADLTIPGGTISPVVSGTQITNVGCPSAMAIDGSHIYALASQGGNTMLMSVPRTGGTVSTLSTIVGGGSVGNTLVVTRTKALFVGSKNGPSELQGVNLANPSPAPTVIPTLIDGKSFGISVFAANDSYLFVSSGGCPCGNNQSNNGGILPTGRIDRFAPDGSGATLLAQFTGVVNAIVLDASFVYWATDTTVWKVPIAGGVAKRIAGNLADGAIPFQCDGSCSIPMNASISIAVDAKNVYIADVSPNVNAIFRVSK